MADARRSREGASEKLYNGASDKAPRQCPDRDISTARRRKLQSLLAPAVQSAPCIAGSALGSRLGTAAGEEEDVEMRLAALEAQHGIDTPQASRAPSRAPSLHGSRMSTGRPLSNAAQSAARSLIGTPARPPSHSQSAPILELAPTLPVINEITRSALTRSMCSNRSPGGCFIRDVIEWSKDSAPVVPSRHRYISSALWGSVNPVYKYYDEESDYKANLVDHKILGPPVRAFMNPRDKNTLYNEEKFKFGNKQIMRKG